jgi:transcriptional regulator
VSTTSVNNWVKGYNTPRMDKIDKICEFFGVNRENLLSEEFKNALIFSGDFDSWKDARFAENIFKDLDFRELIYTLENLSSAQLRALTDMIRLLKSETNV